LFRQLLRLSQHSIIYGFGVVVSQVVGFFLIPVYTRYLTPSDYGTLELLQVTASVLGVIFVMGLNSALFRSYFLYDDAENKKKVVSTVFLFLSASSVLLTLLLVALAGSFSSLVFGSPEYTPYFRLIFLGLFLDTGIMVGLSVFMVRQEPINYALVSVTRVVMGIGLNIFFVVVLHKGVLGILEGTVITSAFAYFMLLGSAIRRTGFRFSFEELKRMLAFGLPLIPGGLAFYILTLSDRYLLQFLSTTTELGLYSLGYKFGLVVGVLLVGPFSTAWGPFVFIAAKEPNARQTFSRVLTYFVLVAMFIALALSVLSKEVLHVMATPAFFNSYKVVPFIALSYVLYGCYYILTVGLSLEAKTMYIAAAVGAAAILNLGLNYLLIPRYGMMGAAAATLIAFLMLALVTFLASQRFYRIDYDWGRIAKICLAAGVVYAGSLFITYESGIIVGVFKLLSLLAYPILLYIFRFYQPEELQKVKEIIKGFPGYIKTKRSLRP